MPGLGNRLGRRRQLLEDRHEFNGNGYQRGKCGAIQIIPGNYAYVIGLARQKIECDEKQRNIKGEVPEIESGKGDARKAGRNRTRGKDGTPRAVIKQREQEQRDKHVEGEGGVTARGLRDCCRAKAEY